MITFHVGAETATANLEILTEAVRVTNLENLDAAIIEAGPGGTVEIVGAFTRTQPYFITEGGAPGLPVTIRGGTFRSNRANPWTPGAADGKAFFALDAGASWLHFSDMQFDNVGNGCFQLGAPAAGLTFNDMTATNVQRFIENRIVANQTDATVDGLTIVRCDVFQFSKGAIRLQYDTRIELVEDVVGISGVDGDNFAIGVHCTGTVHGPFRRVKMYDCIQTRTPELYWNADGFASEEDTHHLIFEDCEASGCTDGGWDLKGNDHQLQRCVAFDNKRNYRLWGRATLTDCVATDPNLRGGTGTQTQVHATASAEVTCTGFTAMDCDPDTIVFDADQTSQIQVTQAEVTRHPASRLYSKETGASVTFGDVLDTLC